MASTPVKSIKSLLASLVGLALVLGLSGAALGGPPEVIPPWLAPLLDRLDDLEAKVDALPGALGPCELPPVWGQTYATTADRFVSVLGGAAFCDKATGLVWDGSPEPTTQASWWRAITHCLQRTVGGQGGFHLPMIEQLTSLLPLGANDMNTPNGPFTGVQSDDGYWSSTTDAQNVAGAWSVDFGSNPFVVGGYKIMNVRYAWCVRGGQSYDGQDVWDVLSAP